MTIDLVEALTEQYATALQQYCSHPDQDSLVARELGDRAVVAGLTMTDLIGIYQQAFRADWQTQSALLPGAVKGAGVDGMSLARRAADFLAQSLLPFERQRQQTEDSLRRGEEQFRAIFENAAIGIVVTDREHRIAHANAFFQNALGYSATELAAYGFTHVVHPDDIPLEQPFVDECLAGTRDNYRLEKRYVCKNGELLWSDMTGTVVRDATGQIQYSVVTMSDITAQKTALHEVRQAEKTLQQLNAELERLNVELEHRVQERTAALMQKNAELEILFQVFPDLFFRMAVDGTYLECKAQSGQDFYLPPEQLIGRRVQDLVPPPLGQRFLASYQEAVQRHALVSLEYALDIQGVEQHFEARILPIQPDQVIAIVRNISDRKRIEAERIQAECALRSQEAAMRRDRALFAGVFEASADALFLVSPVTNCIINCNQQAVALLEMASRDALIGLVGSIFHKEPFLPEDIAAAYAALETSGGWSQEIEYVTQKGNTFWGHCTAKRIQVDGEALHLVRLTDITDRKAAEAAIQISEQNFRTIFNHVSSCICVHDANGIVLDVNDRLLDHIGLTREQVLQSSLLDRASPTKRAFDQEAWQRALAGETVHYETIGGRFGNGVAPDLDVTLNRITWNGNPVILANVQDISDRKQSERRLKRQAEADQLLATIAQTINQSVRLDAVLEHCLEEIRQFLQCDRVLICRFDAANDILIELEAVSRPALALLGQTLHDPCFDQSWAERYGQGHIAVYSDIQSAAIAPCYANFLEQIQVQASVSVGILQADQLWGLLIVHHCTAPHPWQPVEIDLLKQVALHIGIASQKASLYTQLETELAQKEVLLREIHHRVKNNLQVVSALLTLQAEAVQDTTILAALQDSEHRLQAMALIHETLFQSDNVGRLNFSTYVQRLADSILLANSMHVNAINLRYQLEPVFLNLDTAIPCGLLLNELVANALKHAFPDGRQGTVCITLQCLPALPTHQPDHADRDSESPTPTLTLAKTEPLLQGTPPRYRLSISDDGIGIPIDLHLEQLKSLGLRIASDLAQQLRGTLTLEREHGTQFHLTFTELVYHSRF